jgi:hypothetical protein
VSSVRTTMTPPQLARRWGCSPEAILTMVRRGELPAIRLGTGTKRPRHLIPITAIERIERIEREGTVRVEPSAQSRPRKRNRNPIRRYV